MLTSPITGVLEHLRSAVLLQAGAGPTDAQLLEVFITHRDPAAFAALVRRHGPMVWGACRRILRDHHDAEDAFQATFLVLVRKAASVRPTGMVANWLYGVARQTALKARATAARRMGRERPVATMPEPAGTERHLWDDLRPFLDEELSRLPDKYRAVLILCDLEGKTRKEAARQLRAPEGTVAGRLARARAMLARRLARHGLAVSGGALVAIASQQAAAACVPPSVASSTIRAASTFAAGRAAATGAISVKVAILTEGVLKAMLLSKLKTVTVGLLLVTVLAGAAGAIYRAQGAEQPKEKQGNKTATDVSTAQQVRPPRAAGQREYVLTSRLMEDGGDRPKEVLRLPKATFDEGQLVPIHITDGPQNLLANVVLDENLKIGTFFDVRVRHLGGNKVRLILSFERNEIEKSSVSEIRVLGNSLQAVQEVELRKPVKVVFQKDAKGSARRWVEITVDEHTILVPAPPIPVPAPAPAESGSPQKGGRR
jgi:RNA polymerase sigma factor (sigma-70 family)